MTDEQTTLEALKALYIATSKLRLNACQFAPVLKSHSIWDIHTEAMRKAEAAIQQASKPK